MTQMDDLPLDPSPLPPSSGDEPRPIWPWVVGLLIVVAAAAGYFYWRSGPEPAPRQAASAPSAQPADAGQRRLGPDVDAVDLPALDLSDAFVQELVRRLSQHPAVLAWLATPGLIRNIAVCIENVSEGKSPAQHLPALKPSERFRATGRDPVVTDPRSFRRYDGIAAAVGALDMNGVARLYATLKPRLDEAYQELGHRPGELDAATERALLHLLETPVVREDAPLVPVVLSHKYRDADIEALSGAQKQLLRMGPRNVETVRGKLRELALALGIPQERLPRAVTLPAR